MSGFEITIGIKEEQMYCANCSKTIRSALLDLLEREGYSYEYLAADFRSKKVELFLEVESQEAAQAALGKMRDTLSAVGYDCESDAIAGMGDVNQSTGPSAPISHLKKAWYAGPPLIAALFLMLAEHLGWLPSVMEEPGLAINVSIGVVATLMTVWIGRFNFMNAFRAIRSKRLNAMDTLISLGSITAVIYSFLLILEPAFFGRMESMTTTTFFSVPLVVLGLLKLSHALRDHVHAKIESHVDTVGTYKKTLPLTANVLTADAEQLLVEMEVKEREVETKAPEAAKQLALAAEKVEVLKVNGVRKDSLIYVEPNQTVPIDGVLVNSRGVMVREDFFGKKGDTFKKPNAGVFAGAVNRSEEGFVLKTVCEAKDNHIKKAYASIKQTKAAQNDDIERISRFFLWGVLILATVSAVCWKLLGPEPSNAYALQVFLSMIFSACPCAFGLIEVVSVTNKALALEEGILIQDDRVLEGVVMEKAMTATTPASPTRKAYESLARWRKSRKQRLSVDQVTDICLDKCGTLTTGKYALTGLLLEEGESQDKALQKEYLAYAVILEGKIDKKDRSAVAEAIIGAAEEWELNLTPYICESFRNDPLIGAGRGGVAIINKRTVVVGNKALLKNQGVAVSKAWLQREKRLGKEDKMAIFLAIDGQVCALLVLKSAEENEPVLRPGTQEAIEWFLAQGKVVHILTGDTESRTKALTASLATLSGKGEIKLSTKKNPQKKIDYIRALQEAGRTVVMLGDDSNDIGALKQANFGFAIDALAPVRSEAAVVLNGSLRGMVQLMRLARIHRWGRRTSIGLAFGINSFALMFSAGVFYPLTHMLLDPTISGAVMAGSSLALILNISLFKRIGRKAMQKALRDKPTPAGLQQVKVVQSPKQGTETPSVSSRLSVSASATIELLSAEPKVPRQEAQLLQQTQTAIEQGNTGQVQVLLTESGLSVNAEDESGQSLLHVAAQSSHTAITQLLLDKKATVDHPDTAGRTPLFCALSAHPISLKTVALLVSAKADPSVRSQAGETPLDVAQRCGEGNKDLMDLLHEGSRMTATLP
jgi:Cu+-exporting ATPase